MISPTLYDGRRRLACVVVKEISDCEGMLCLTLVTAAAAAGTVCFGK